MKPERKVVSVNREGISLVKAYSKLYALISDVRNDGYVTDGEIFYTGNTINQTMVLTNVFVDEVSNS